MAGFLFYDDKIINILSKEEKPSGGAAVQAYGWIRGLSEVGQDIYVMTNTCQNGSIKEDCKHIKLIPLYDNKKGIRWARWIYYRLPFIYRQIKQAKPEYLYQGIPGWTSFVLAVICKRLRIKYILRISNDYLLDDRFYKNYGTAHRYFQRLGMRLSYCILCQNDYQLRIIKNLFPGKKAIKISNPIFLKYSGQVPAAADRKYIAWLGLYQYQKNLQLLFEIACLFKDEQFLIAGKEESKCDEDTINYLEKLRELPNVTFTGFLHRHEVLPFLSNAKFLLNTSHYEGFSNTFLEAMSVGTPIISSDKVNPDAIITDHNLGIVYNNIDDLKRQYVTLTPAVYEAMSKNVKEYVILQHDYRILSGRLMHFLNSN
jgi:glycosyltransferase involved in cell wall biosynthesis